MTLCDFVMTECYLLKITVNHPLTTGGTNSVYNTETLETAIEPVYIQTIFLPLTFTIL